MGWRRGSFGISYGEIMGHLYDDCRMADGSVDEFCVSLKRKNLAAQQELYERQAARAERGGMDPGLSPAENEAYRQWQQSWLARKMQREAEEIFGKARPENLEEERDLMARLRELFERYRDLI